MHKLSLIFTIAPAATQAQALSDGARLAREALQSALDCLRRQTLKGWELVCVVPDDIPADLMRRLRRLRGKKSKLIEVPAKTPLTEQRNAGLDAATGKYVAFLHSKNSFTPRFLSGLVRSAERENAALVIGRQRSFGTFGGRDFSSAEALSLRRSIHCTDYRLLWNPSVSNKLYRLEDIRRLGLRFQDDFGFAADALFTLSFAFATKAVASSRRGYAQWREEPFSDSAPTQAELASYVSAYGQIVKQAESYFSAKLTQINGDFLLQESRRAHADYLDQAHSKLLTVLIYRFYRRFYSIEPSLLVTAARAILREYDMLSESGKSALRRAHKDIMLDDNLPNSPEEAAETRKLSVLLCGERTADELAIQLESLAAQTLPFFELLCDEELKPLFPSEWLNDQRLRFISAPDSKKSAHNAAIKQAALEQSTTRYLLILERPALLDPKALQRHWHSIKKEPDAGFTTAPYSRFDGGRVSEYSTARLYFGKKKNAVRERVEQVPDFPLDLFWENKLLRLRHLKGVRFTFSSSAAVDCCRLYKNASFIRLDETAVYLTLTQDELLAVLRQEDTLLPPELRIKTHYLRYKTFKVKLRKAWSYFSEAIKRVQKLPAKLFLRLVRALCYRLPIKDETLFYTTRPVRLQKHNKAIQGLLPVDLKLIYNKTQGKKTVLAQSLPHSIWQSTKSYLSLMRAKIIVTDGTVPALANFRLRKGQRILQIWHSCGAYKRYALDAPLDHPRSIEKKSHSQYSAAIVSSEYCRDFAAHAFGIEPERVLPLGSPRTDIFLDSEAMQKRRERMLRNHPVLRGKKIYVYCPTSRSKEFDPKIRWKKLSQSLHDDEIFIIHRHPLTEETYIAGRHYRRVRDYSYEPLADMLAVCDVLVTDYSAVVQEAALIGKPVLFYCPDWEDYEREFYLSFPDELPGKLVTDWAELTEALRKTFEKPKTERLADFAKKQMGACDGNSTERICHLIKQWQR